LLKGVSIYLIGMMGSGKTTIGKKLANRLSYRFLDLDSLIEKVTKKTINEIFATGGESAFRAIESQILAETSSYTRTVISTGGGAILEQTNWGSLRHGLIIWLDAPIEVIFSRLATDDTRPLLRVANPLLELTTILENRISLYQQADLKILQTLEQTPEEIIEEIILKIPSVLKNTKQQTLEYLN